MSLFDRRRIAALFENIVVMADLMEQGIAGDMNDREMHCMIAIEKAGSIQKASTVMEMNPSSLSRMVRRLEEEFDITLFRRTPSGVIPTPEGKVYLKAAEDILKLYGELRQQNDGDAAQGNS